MLLGSANHLGPDCIKYVTAARLRCRFSHKVFQYALSAALFHTVLLHFGVCVGENIVTLNALFNGNQAIVLWIVLAVSVRRMRPFGKWFVRFHFML